MVIIQTGYKYFTCCVHFFCRCHVFLFVLLFPSWLLFGHGTSFFECFFMKCMHCRYSRGWFYHREHQLWLMRIGEPLVKTQTYERGSYHFFDPSAWQTIRKVRTSILLYYIICFLLLTFYMLDKFSCSYAGQCCPYLRGIGEEANPASALDFLL